MTIKICNDLFINGTNLSYKSFMYSNELHVGGGSSGPSWQDIVLSGVGSLTLANAKANSLNYLKLYGACEQDGTPTPTTPKDIICNNGAIKFRHQSGLPLGFTLLEYIEADGTQFIDTGVKLASTDVVESEFANTSSSGYGALYGVYKTGESSAFYANQTYYGYDVVNNKVDTGTSVNNDWHTVVHDFVNGKITLDGVDTSFTPFEFENANNNYLFARYYNNSYGYGFKGKCRKHIAVRGTATLYNLLPVKRDSDDVLGMYDMTDDNPVTAFHPNIGTGDLIGGNPVSDPVIMYIDGTTETVKDSLNNTATAQNLFAVGTYKDVQEVLTGAVTRNIGIKVLDGTENWYKISNQNAYYIKGDDMLYCNPVQAGLSNQFVGSAESTANMPDNSVKLTYVSGPNGGAILIKYNDTTTLEDWQQFLADQYQANKPVIVIYPLVTATSETVTGQHLTTKSGSNTITITQASISNLPLEVSYKGIV